VTRKQDSATKRIRAEDLRQVLAEDRDVLKVIIEETLQQVLEAEMDEALQAGKGERTASRLGYRSGYYGRTLVTRVGKIEWRVPQDRQGRFERKCSSVSEGTRRRKLMPATAKRKPKKATPTKPADVNTTDRTTDISDGLGDIGHGFYGLGKEIEGVAEESRPLYHLELLAEYLGSLASALDNLANATAISAIAKHGTEEDRTRAIEYLKQYFRDW
jgi:hypothetical protein